MRSDVIRVYKSLHTWTGLIAGMLLFIGFYAGALTMFKDPLDRWATPPSQQKVAATDWPAAGQWPALIAATLDAHPGAARGFTLHLKREENTPAPLVWREGGDEHGGGRVRGATLDADGELVTLETAPSAMAELIDLLHQTGGIPGRGHHYWGVYAMGVVCVLYVLALVSGLVVLLPTLVKDFFALRRGRNLKRFWLDAHNVVGITSLPFHLMIGLTVIVFAFHDQIYGALGQVVYGDRPLFERPAPAPESAPRGVDHLLAPATLLATLRETEPAFVPRELIYSDPLGPRADLRVAGESEGHMRRGANRGFASLDPYTGAITNLDYLPGHEDTWIDIVTVFFALHFGNFGGPVIRWSYVLLGLGGAFLFYTGNLLWVESRRRKQRRGAAPVSQRRATRAMAAATVGVCWGCVAGVSAAMVAGKWVQGLVTDPNAWYPAVYYTVFLGSVAWAFWRGAARAVVELLWVSALTTLAIPVTGLVAWLAPSLPPWVYPRPGLLSVEISALLAGGLLVLAARRTARRVRQGSADSVWSRADADGEARSSLPGSV
ncbi:PepSY-associated TM helix domain-containing protein [Alloalcanivorax sp. C16-2]|uniref:PepSY-associated TM helix domain-containing protein n=1 Tax=Alloalcanivorax sp. C16-2 TaxID=3390052 RepID=UPI0039711719